MTEVLFYHLERARLEQVLPGLLQKSLERGWKVVVQTGLAERVEDLNTLLWSWNEESFLPHGASGDGFDSRQPIWLTSGDDRPNEADVRFFVDGAVSGDVSPYERVVHLFNGRDSVEVTRARAEWKKAREAGHDVTYWRQGPQGGWQKQA